MTISVPYNDRAAVEKAFAANPAKISAIIVEPVAANMGVVPPVKGFLAGLREIASREKALLIFDEVITGFRLCFGGAQNLFGISPDLTVLGKIIGGGLPVAAYGGRREIMDRVAPLGAVYQAGTLSGNPLAMRAGIEMLKQIAAPNFYETLNERAERLRDGLRAEIKSSGIAAQVQSIGSLLTLFLTAQPVKNFADASKCDTARFAKYFREMLDRGVLLAPSQFEALFVSAAHSDADIDATLVAVRESFHAISGAARTA